MEARAEGSNTESESFLTEYQRGMRAAILGAILGVILALLARRR